MPTLAPRARRILKSLALAALSILCAARTLPAGAADYPERALRLVVPFAPGGSTDVLARIVGQRLGEAVGQPVIIDNRPAAGGTVGSDLVAKAAPDGYTLLIGSIATMVIAKAMYAKMPYDPLTDFEHVNLWVTFPLALVVPAASPYKTTQEFIAAARSKPGAMRFGAQGIGTSSHAFAELMNSMSRIKVVIVPYKGGAPAMNGLLAGEVDYAMIAVSTALSQVASGKLRALGVTSARPTATMPNVPSIAAALPGYDALNFHGLHAPRRTPRAVIARLHDETTRVLRQPEVIRQLANIAMDIDAGTPEQYREFIRKQLDQWVPVVKASGAKAE